MNVNIISVESVGSTNSYLKELAHTQRLEEGVTVVAYDQTAGRGQRGNTWESEAGKNITCSILLYPQFLPMKQYFLLSELISISIIDTIKSFIAFDSSAAFSDPITIKWPNDIYYNEKKLGGILIENEILGNVIEKSIAGIGLNVNQESFYSDAPNPVSLLQITGREWNLDKLLKKLIENIASRYGQLKAGDTATIIRMYHEALYRKFGFHRYEDEQGAFSARIDRVSDDGLLHLITGENQQRSYGFKAVRYL